MPVLQWANKHTGPSWPGVFIVWYFCPRHFACMVFWRHLWCKDDRLAGHWHPGGLWYNEGCATMNRKYRKVKHEISIHTRR